MTSYVDDVRHQYGRMIMCHLWSDDLDELHAMAAAIGVARIWFQEPPKASWCHYDISLSMKAKARALGAVLTDKYGPSYHVAMQRENWRMVNSVFNCRRAFGLPLDGVIG